MKKIYSSKYFRDQSSNGASPRNLSIPISENLAYTSEIHNANPMTTSPQSLHALQNDGTSSSNGASVSPTIGGRNQSGETFTDSDHGARLTEFATSEKNHEDKKEGASYHSLNKDSLDKNDDLICEEVISGRKEKTIETVSSQDGKNGKNGVHVVGVPTYGNSTTCTGSPINMKDKKVKPSISTSPFNPSVGVSLDGIESSFLLPIPHPNVFFDTPSPLPSTSDMENSESCQRAIQRCLSELNSPDALSKDNHQPTGKQIVVSEESGDEEGNTHLESGRQLSTSAEPGKQLPLQRNYIEDCFQQLVDSLMLNHEANNRNCTNENSVEGLSVSVKRKVNSHHTSLVSNKIGDGSMNVSHVEDRDKSSTKNLCTEGAGTILSNNQTFEKTVYGTPRQEDWEEEHYDALEKDHQLTREESKEASACIGLECGSEDLFSSTDDAADQEAELSFDPTTICHTQNEQHEDKLSKKEELRLLNLKLFSYKLRIRECKILNRQKLCNLKRKYLDLQTRKYSLVLKNLEQNEKKYVRHSTLFNFDEED